jgi:hypothetical protein
MRQPAKGPRENIPDILPELRGTSFVLYQAKSVHKVS